MKINESDRLEGAVAVLEDILLELESSKKVFKKLWRLKLQLVNDYNINLNISNNLSRKNHFRYIKFLLKDITSLVRYYRGNNIFAAIHKNDTILLDKIQRKLNGTKYKAENPIFTILIGIKE